MSDPQYSSSASSASSRFAAWLANNPPRVLSRRRSQPEVLTALHDTTQLRTSSPPPAKRRCVPQIKSAPVSPTSTTASSHPPFPPTLFDLPQAPTKSDVPKPAQIESKPLSWVRRRVNRIVRIINATFAVCEGQPTRALAYPVYQIHQDLFNVPATYSDFQLFHRYRGQTNARKVKASFDPQVVFPSSTKTSPCISVEMPGEAHEDMKSCLNIIEYALKAAGWTLPGGRLIKYKDKRSKALELTIRQGGQVKTSHPQPDGALSVDDNYPFLVMEIAVSQTQNSLALKVHNWVQGCRANIKIIVTFELEPDAAGPTRCLASVIRVRKQINPQNPQLWSMVGDRVIDREEVWPNPPTSPGAIIINLADVLPKDTIDHRTPPDPIRIPLSEFQYIAEGAANVLATGDVYSPRSSNQESVSEPDLS
ncbi:MAG: hypothetical protein Q9226_006686 [Calogaya cf. arnoldii]